MEKMAIKNPEYVTEFQQIVKNNSSDREIQTYIESHIDALNSRAKSMRILDTTTVTSEQLKGWINQWQKALSK